MPVSYLTSLKNARLDQVTDAIGANGKIQIGTAGMATILSTVPLATPAAPPAVNGVLTFTMPQSDTSAAASGLAAEARIVTSGLSPVVSGLTVGVGAGDVQMDSLNIASTQTLTLNSATITHG